jgi:hypothetical protein
MVLVESDGTTFYVEVADSGGVGTVGLEDLLSFNGVADTVTALAASLASAWKVAKPAEATVEFGLAVTAKSGKLTGLLVEGGGQASLKVTMTWRSASSGADPAG